MRVGGNWARRPWDSVRRLSSRTSLRTKLITALLALVIIALTVIGVAFAAFMRSYLLGQVDQQLKSQNLQNAAVRSVSDTLSGNTDPFAQQNEANLAEAGYAVWWIPAGGKPQQIVQPASSGFAASSQGNVLPAKSLTAIQSHFTSISELTTTVPGQAAGDRWRIIGINELVSNGTTGTLVIGEDVSSVYTTIRQLTGVDLIVSVVIVFVLAIIGFAVVQANLRPLVDIEETAGEIAAGHLNQRVPERDPRTEIGRLGRSLNSMLSQIETAFHAREESEAAAHRSEERMRRFIADASHELRTPLTTIRGFAEYYRQRGGLVQGQAGEEARQKPGAAAGNTDGTIVPAGAAREAGAAGPQGLTGEDLDRIMQRVEAEAARMGILVEDLLLLARLDQQRPLARRPVDLLTLAADAVHDARLLAPARSIDLSVQPGAAFIVTGDEPRIRQIIGNLMSNALTHTPDGTPIEVSISSGALDPRKASPEPAAVLEVTDHGPGMTPEQADRAFERFYRVDQARTRKAGGSGLGLAIVSALVAAHGGVASVRTIPGNGATFRIALPLAPEAHGTPQLDDDADQGGLADSGGAADGIDGTGDAAAAHAPSSQR
jgi:two-component system, OmpR family, sensor kinase